MSKKCVELVTFDGNFLFAFLLYFGLCLLVLGFAPVISSLNLNHQPRASLVCESPEYDFGEVSGTDFPSHKFVLSNRGKAPISILKVMPGCGSCIFVVDYTRSPISPRDKGFVALQLLTGSLEGTVSKEVLVTTDDPVPPAFLLTLNAKILPSNDIE